ncbi:Concanavalin A-like lectin/glucanases superfamily protein [Streptomyces sp. Amel2xC10]|nr:Concanavalin A-like lectin/glucanases superfamily protein [Streptomyces sp. Amel2xC10]
MFAVTLTLLVTPPHTASAAPVTADPAAPTEAQRASAKAQESGERVEVTGERTDRTTTFANPDGFTFTLEQSVVPIRVAKPDGGWQEPDATLAKRSDGSVGPKAAAVTIAFSAGGDKEPLASIEDHGRSLELEWPGKLPAPTLNGPTAVYADVLPDVDLQVTATPESFQPVFVVKTPEAAANEELKKLTFGLKAKGLDVHEGAVGNLMAVDGSGLTVFKSPPARMWDSAGATSGKQTQLMRAEEGPGEPTASADPAELAPSGSGLEPGQGDKVAKMDVAVTKDSLSVVPDAAMLTKTDASAFPLFIDPRVSWGEAERTLLRSDGYESYGWGNGDDDQGKGAGKCGTWNGYYCGPGYVQKLYFEFSPANLKGKKVLDATFRVTEPWAFQCDPRWVDLVRTNNISSATTWASRPKELDLMVDRNVSAGRGSLCDPDSPNAPIEFNDNPEETNENLTSTVSDFAAGKFSRLTLQIRAHDESDPSAWKRFKNDAVLVVKFVGVPALPTEVGLVTGNSYVCSTSSTDPAVVSSPMPLVQGKPRTASGGSAGASLRIRWRTEKLEGSAWTVAHTDLDGPSSGYVGNLVKQSRSLPTLKEGVLYRLKALTMSYYEDGSSRQNTGYTTPCYFKVDSTSPKAPKVGFSGPYTECTTNDCVAHGGPGETGAFTLAPASGDTNVVSYQYRMSTDATWTDQPGSTATIKIKPDKAGTHRLYVRAKDNVGIGREGAQTVVDFLVAAGQTPVGRWSFAEASGAAVDTATNTGVARHNATLGSGAVRDDRGRRGVITRDASGELLATPVVDKGLSLDGSGAYAATDGPVLETRSAYTVAAWARLNTKSQDAIVLSQDGQNYSAFLMWYDKSYGSWVFGVKQKDEDTGTAYYGVVGKVPATVGSWTHLAGSFDPATGLLKFYVNGELQGSRTVTGGWSATGPFNMGRYLWAGQRYWAFNGSIDEVTAWQRVASDAEIREEARLLTSQTCAGVELVADWSADRGSGTTVTDTTSGYGRSLTLAGGAALDGEAIVLDGVDDAASVAGPVVDDTGSFTVTALAGVDKKTLATKDIGYIGQVVGQRTSDGSAWGFWYELTAKETVLDEETLEEKTVPVGFWRFGRLNTDGTFSAVASEEAAVVDGMVRMTGVYNAQDGTISLYLGAVQNGDDKPFTAKIGSGDFAVGKGFNSSAWRYYLPGRVAEVRLWAGAMASSDQVSETVGD